uniref:Uncharacterized protein n=1 Tax=Kalanchoe fedtschenkoi TaxID=63787 RepID=A0A7N0U4K5_KALFE
MQTPKSKASTIQVPSRKSPKTSPTARQIKTPGSSSEPVSAPSNKDRSPKVIERKTPRSPISEQKKRQIKASDSKSQIVQLQEDLKLTKDKLISSELLKAQAEVEAEEAKKQLSAMTTKLQDTEKQLVGNSNMEESGVRELCKVSQDRDRACKSEIEAAQKQHSEGSAELPAALNEIYVLKKQLDAEAESGGEQCHSAGSAADELQILRSQHEKSVAVVDKLEDELTDCKKSETQSLTSNQSQLDAAWEKDRSLKLDILNARTEYETLASELEESKAKVMALEMLVSKLQSELVTCSDGEGGMNERSSGDTGHYLENAENQETEKLKLEIVNLKYEDCKLRAALEAAEMRCQEVRIQSTLETTSVYEQAESAKLDFKSKEAELEAQLQRANSDIKELQAKLAEKENRLQTYAEQELLNNGQKRQLELHLAALQETLFKKENLLQATEKENGILKGEVRKWEMEKSRAIDEFDGDTVAKARVADQKAVRKTEYVSEESDKNSKRTARVMEQLDAAQAANAELESELRKLKVQSDQWRKAAEAAAAMLTSGNNGKYIDRTGSLDSSYHTLGGRISSPFSDDLNDEPAKKKNGNMLKKIGGLWKKGQNQK